MTIGNSGVANQPWSERAPLLDMRGLSVSLDTSVGRVSAVRDISLQIPAGEAVCLVGESGSGKTMTALALLDLVPGAADVSIDQLRWKGLEIDQTQLRDMRGSQITMVFQDPVVSLNPLKTVGVQVSEVLRYHLGYSRRSAMIRTLELLELVRIPEPQRRVRQYPHELSGGLAQRVLIAMALAPEGALLLADEPTTALDVNVQAQLLRLIKSLQVDLGLSMLFISHDLAVVSEIGDHIAVMYAGRIVEVGPASEVIHHPKHRYTAALLNSTPQLGDHANGLASIPGQPPSLIDEVDGCAFAPRCDFALSRCDTCRPTLIDETGALSPFGSHVAACWHELSAP